MKLSEISAGLTDEQRGRLQEHPVWQTCRPVRWPATMLDYACAVMALHALPSEAVQALELIVCGFSAVPFKEEQLLQAAVPGTAGAALRLGLLRLTEAGIVFPFRKGWGEKMYMLPSESFFSWHRAIMNVRNLGRDTLHNLSEVDPMTVEAIDEQGYIPPFSMQLLHAMARMDQEGMKLTTRGVLSKRTISIGKGQLYVRDATLNALVDGAAGRVVGCEEEVYPPAFLFVLEMMLEQQWLAERDGAFHLQDEAWHTWLNQPSANRDTTLFQGLLAAISAHSASAATGGALLAELESGKWFLVHEVDAAYRSSQLSLARPHYSTIRDWCFLLREMGWMELAVDGMNQSVMRWRMKPYAGKSRNEPERSDLHGQSSYPAAATEPSVQMTPDGDFYVDETCPYHVRWQLEIIAERRRTDYIAVYRLDRDSCRRAALGKYTLHSLIALIEQLTQEPIPTSMISLIQHNMEAGWTQGDFMSDASGETSAPRAAKPAKPAKAPKSAKPAKAIFPTSIWRSSTGPYQLIGDPPSMDHLFNGIDEVPAMWLKQFRQYHPSTRRELLEQAVTWRTAVKLNCKGVLTLFIPERIIHEAGGWAVEGYQENMENKESPPAVVTLYPEMWEEMMLQLPIHTGNL